MARVTSRAIGFFVSLLFSASANAGTVIVSGDTNIAHGIDGSELTNQGDNGIFFTNVLGAGKQVLIEDQLGGFDAAPIKTLYDGLGGVTTTVIGTAPTAAQLSTADLFIDFEPTAAYDAGTIGGLSALLNRGGMVFFLGDNFIFDADNAVINTDLAALGGALQIVLNTLPVIDELDEPAIVVPNPLTAGVTNFTNVSTSAVSGGTPLFLSNDGRVPALPFVEDQTLGGPAPAPAAEPASASVLAVALVALGFARRRVAVSSDDRSL
jgi:hypothetical protein